MSTPSTKLPCLAPHLRKLAPSLFMAKQRWWDTGFQMINDGHSPVQYLLSKGFSCLLQIFTDVIDLNPLVSSELFCQQLRVNRRKSA